MSKISEQIQAVQVGKKAFQCHPLVHIKEEGFETRYQVDGYVYHIGVEIRKTVICKLGEISIIKSMVVRDINEYLYGDIKEALHEAYYALYERDFDKMKQALDTAMETIAV